MPPDSVFAKGYVFHPATDTWVPEQTASGFGIPDFDQLIVTFTDSTKATISTVVYKASGATVATLTLVQATLTDTYTKT